MTDAMFRIIDSYARIYNRWPPIAITWSPKTHRLVSITEPRALTGWILSCIFTMGLSEGIKLLQAAYLIIRTVKIGHFPSSTEEPFASPMQLLSIAVISIGSGGGILISLFAYLCSKQISTLLNQLLILEEHLTQRGNQS